MFIQIIRYLVPAFSLLAWVELHAEESYTIQTPSHQTLEILIDRSQQDGPGPTLIMASGSGYHMRQPLLASLALQLASKGITVVRFNWGYFQQDAVNGKPSANRKQEIADLEAVMAFVETQPGIDRQQLFIGGKSLGSIIAWQSTAARASAKGLVLLTPVCKGKDGEVLANNYPSIDQGPSPSAWILGNSDPVCPAPALYKALANASAESRISVVSGDHSFQSKADHSGDIEARFNIVADLIAEFIRNQLSK